MLGLNAFEVRSFRFTKRLTGIPSGRAAVLAVSILASLSLAACGAASSTGSAGAAHSALTKSFAGADKIKSGNLQLSLTLTPVGSSILSTPISLSVSGPFAQGTGATPPEFNLSATLNALGQNLSFGLISTGTDAYVTLQDTPYTLPSSVTQLLTSGATSSSEKSAAGKLSKLGLDPLGWLENPTVVGTETIDGTATTHVHAGVNLKAMIANIGQALATPRLAREWHVGQASGHATGAAGSGGSLMSGLIPKLEAAIQNPTVDTWTGNSDNILRKFEVALTVSLSGLKLPSILSGLSAVNVDLTAQINDLNQPQTITAPSNPQPFSAFEAQVKSLLSQLSNIPGLGGLLGGAGSTTSSSPTITPSSPAKVVKRYSRCIKHAGTDAAKLQKCAALLSNG
jgi:hypothetical protein